MGEVIVRRAVMEDLPAIVAMLDEIDELHRRALPWLFRQEGERRLRIAGRVRASSACRRPRNDVYSAGCATTTLSTTCSPTAFARRGQRHFLGAVSAR